MSSHQPDNRRSILERLDEQVVSEEARRESRNREKHLPPLGIFRWWARRTGAVNRSILKSATDHFGRDQLTVLDPFAGGGTIPLVALQLGHQVQSQDINPWAVHGVHTMLTLPHAEELDNGLEQLIKATTPVLHDAYATKDAAGSDATILHTFRVACASCTSCGHPQRLFPYSLLTLEKRKERSSGGAIFACRQGHVFRSDSASGGKCTECLDQVCAETNYTPRRLATCISCGNSARLSELAAKSGIEWEPVLVERICGNVRSFDMITPEEKIKASDSHWQTGNLDLGAIPQGVETSVLLRHGFSQWVDLFPSRQLFVTETLLSETKQLAVSKKVRTALELAIVGTTEFAGHLCRWDRFYLKLNDATAGHRFNFTTFVPELNVVGKGKVGRGTLRRRVHAMQAASRWLDEADLRQTRTLKSRPGVVATKKGADALVVHGDSRRVGGEDGRFDLVLTDPPYHDDVQYGELSLLFRVWAHLEDSDLSGEATANRVARRNLDGVAYSNTLCEIYSECRRVLKSDGRLIFSFANAEPSAWVSLFEALDTAGLRAIASLSVHSENETDFKKRRVRSELEDLILELSPNSETAPTQSLSIERLDPFMQAVCRGFEEVGNNGHRSWTEVLKELESLRDKRLPNA